MQIFEHQHRRRPGLQFLQQRRDDLVRSRLALYELLKLAVAGATSRNGPEHPRRQQRLTRTPQHPDRSALRFTETTQQRRLPDPRLPLNEHQPPLRARAHPSERIHQHRQIIGTLQKRVRTPDEATLNSLLTSLPPRQSHQCDRPPVSHATAQRRAHHAESHRPHGRRRPLQRTRQSKARAACSAGEPCRHPVARRRTRGLPETRLSAKAKNHWTAARAVSQWRRSNWPEVRCAERGSTRPQRRSIRTQPAAGAATSFYRPMSAKPAWSIAMRS